MQARGRFASLAVIVVVLASTGGHAQMSVSVSTAEMSPSVRGVAQLPYSAQFKTTRTQTLADGTTVTHEATGTVARDSEGRTYREETREIGEGDHKRTTSFITINDPVAAERIDIRPQSKTADIRHFSTPAVPPISPPSQPLDTRSASSAVRPATASNRLSIEKLGTKEIDGVTVEGTRTVRTIPAGQDGNSAPLVVTHERWYSPELKVELEYEHSDPSTGISKTEYSNIQRGEPDPALFRIPDDYTVKETEQVQLPR